MLSNDGRFSRPVQLACVRLRAHGVNHLVVDPGEGSAVASTKAVTTSSSPDANWSFGGGSKPDYHEMDADLRGIKR